VQVEFSKQLNESRLKVLQAREDAVHAVLHEGYERLAALSKDAAKYKQLIADLLVQVGRFSTVAHSFTYAPDLIDVQPASHIPAGVGKLALLGAVNFQSSSI
jgi:hypothetical protein